MVKKKTTKEIRAIDRIIKFQIDDGIESLTISGKEALADLEIDNKNNVTLYLNADGDKINELTSLVPFINLAVKEEGVDPDKQKSVTLSQDLTQFALEIADNSKELASLIKSESSIILDLDGLVQKLLEIAGKLAELEAKNLEQDNRLTVIEAKDLEQDNRLTVIESKDLEQDERLTEIDVTQDAHAGKLYSLEEKDIEQDGRLTVIKTKDLEQDNRLTVIETKDLEQDNRLTELESNGQTQEQLYNVSTHTLVHDFSNSFSTFYIGVKEKNEDGKVFGHLTFKYIDQNNQTIIHTIPLSQTNGFDNYVIQHDNYIYTVQSLILSQETLEPSGYSIQVDTNIYIFMGSLIVNSVLYKETPNTDNEHITAILEAEIFGN